MRYFHVSLHARPYVDAFRTELPRAADRQRGAYSELSRLVRARGDDTTSLSVPGIGADDHRPAFVLGMIELFDGRVERIHVDVKYGAHAPYLDVIHQLPLGAARAADQFFKRDAVQDAADRAIDFRPDRFELAHILFAAIIKEVSRLQARELNKGATHRADHIADRELIRRPRQHIAAFGAPAAPDDIDPLQNLHDLEQEFHRNVLALRDIVHAHRRLTVVVQGEFQHGGTCIFISCGNLHRSPTGTIP